MTIVGFTEAPRINDVFTLGFVGVYFRIPSMSTHRLLEKHLAMLNPKQEAIQFQEWFSHNSQP